MRVLYVVVPSGYLIQPDGLKRVDVIENNNKNMITSNAVQGLRTEINTLLSYKLDIKPTNAASGLTDCNTANTGFLCGSNVSNAPQSSTGFIYLLTLKYDNNSNYKTQLCFFN